MITEPNMMRIFVLFIWGLLFAANGFCQTYNPDKVNKKAKAIFEEAYTKASRAEYAESLELLNNALKIDPNFLEANLARAEIYAKMKNYNGAVAEFEIAFNKDPQFSSSYLLPYSTSLSGAGKFDRALDVVNKYLANPSLNARDRSAALARKKTYEFALAYAATHPDGSYIFNPENLGDSINSDALEYFPSFTVDGNKMIFNRRINRDEDFYESIRVNGKWQHAVPVAGKLNTNYNEGAQNISQDGEWLIFTGCNYPEGAGSCDLYISYRMPDGQWTEAENMGRAINTEFWESAPSLSPDKRDLYFSSTRPGGLGGSDIWISHRDEKGKWSKPENAGPQINTAGDDGFPFIHADNRTLFFNSNGHAGYGGTDLFLIRKNDEGKWDTAQNLGYPVNTIDDEASLVVSADGKTAYYSSDKGNYKNGLDLYSFELREENRASKTLWVRGKIYDKKTNEGLPSSVALTTIDGGYVLSNLQTDANGNYLTTLPSGKNYAFNVNRKGYLLYSETFKMTGNISDSPMVVNIPLQPIETGASVILKNIFFASKSFELDKTSNAELDKVVALMEQNPTLVIMISGHTDNVGKPSDNLILSVNRAKAIINYIASKGIDPKRLSGKGFGEGKPVSSNDTEEGRAKNRRTEMTVVSK